MGQQTANLRSAGYMCSSREREIGFDVVVAVLDFVLLLFLFKRWHLMLLMIDSSKNEDVVEVSEHVNSHVPHSSKPNLSVSSSMHKLLDCPVCLYAMYPPIHQCSNGHTLCSGCKLSVHNSMPRLQA
ncbi:hypothetical protein OPV22_026331 [Ensete ventricosum]|uniref:E3 ubiquitin-protein ligase Sina-like RING finger domain-containing protein n=1 Tax=Ensete ventricosum TaxID=4639 RepID=A0AAV8QF39_ENSVE|nr:hypothetical protein OPV22_026331 [Ensete ventricosum]